MSRSCDCCRRRRCNRVYKVPVGTPTKIVVHVCGKCLTYEAQRTRAWLDAKEKELERR